jgi:hypothetical protein
VSDLAKCLIAFFAIPGALGALWIWVFIALTDRIE